MSDGKEEGVVANVVMRAFAPLVEDLVLELEVEDECVVVERMVAGGLMLKGVLARRPNSWVASKIWAALLVGGGEESRGDLLLLAAVVEEGSLRPVRPPPCRVERKGAVSWRVAVRCHFSGESYS